MESGVMSSLLLVYFSEIGVWTSQTGCKTAFHIPFSQKPSNTTALMGIITSLFEDLFGDKDLRILMVGLDAAGKVGHIHTLY